MSSDSQETNSPQIIEQNQPVQNISIPEIASQWTGNLVSEDPIVKFISKVCLSIDCLHLV